jgi:hypothetical protein
VAEIQKADSRARRRAFIIIVCGTALGASLILLADAYSHALAEWMARRPELACAVLAGAIVGPILGFAVYLWRLGNRVVRAERFPPPGMALVRDAFVLREHAARRRGRIAQAMAIGLALASVALAGFLWQLWSLLQKP